jgi:hypothetical protein
MSADNETWLRPAQLDPLRGDEQFLGLDASVADFWRWGFSDLRDNTTRGVLAEFIVARAVGDDRPRRIGWDNFDVLMPGAPPVRIEVKSSAFLQSWSQKQHSELVFGRLFGRAFDADTNEYSAEPEVRADVFVFAVQTQKEPSSYAPLDLSRWSFYVVSAADVRDHGAKTASITWVCDHAGEPVSYDGLAKAVRVAAEA